MSLLESDFGRKLVTIVLFQSYLPELGQTFIILELEKS